MRLLIVNIVLLSLGFSQLGLNLHVGTGMTSLRNEDNDVETESEMNFNGGISLNVSGINVGAGFSQRGAVEDDLDFSFSYIDLWALYPVSDQIPTELPVTISAGVNIGMFLNGNAKFEDVTLEFNDADEGTEDWIESLDYGLLFVTSYPVNESLSVNAGYYHGISDVFGELWEDAITHYSLFTGITYSF